MCIVYRNEMAKKTLDLPFGRTRRVEVIGDLVFLITIKKEPYSI